MSPNTDPNEAPESAGIERNAHLLTLRKFAELACRPLAELGFPEGTDPDIPYLTWGEAYEWLERLGTLEGVTPQEAVKRLGGGVPPEMLEALEAAGFIARTPVGRFRPGALDELRAALAISQALILGRRRGEMKASSLQHLRAAGKGLLTDAECEAQIERGFSMADALEPFARELLDAARKAARRNHPKARHASR